MTYRKPIRFSVMIEIEPEDRELIKAEGVYDPSSKSDLRTMAQVAVEQMLSEWHEQRVEEGRDE